MSAVPKEAGGCQVQNKRRWFFAQCVAKLQNSSPRDMTNTRNLPGSKEAAAWKSKTLGVAVKTQHGNSGMAESEDSSRDVFLCCCLSIIFFCHCCTECLVRGITDLTPCSCLCIFMFKSSLRRMEGMTKLSEKSKLKLAVKQCRKCCNSA